MRSAVFIILLSFIAISSMLFLSTASNATLDKGSDIMNKKPEGYPSAILAGGCFWCIESEFRAIDGVLFTEAGYIGGHINNPTYQDITTGKSGHAEALRIIYDDKKVSYSDLVDFFLTKAHDPTQLNQQGVDKGPQYRSAIFYQNDQELEIAKGWIEKLNTEKRFKKPVVTTLEPATTFWVAEDYHQQYYEKYEEQNGQPHIRVLLKKGKKGFGF